MVNWSFCRYFLLLLVIRIDIIGTAHFMSNIRFFCWNVCIFLLLTSNDDVHYLEFNSVFIKLFGVFQTQTQQSTYCSREITCLIQSVVVQKISIQKGHIESEMQYFFSTFKVYPAAPNRWVATRSQNYQKPSNK